ncbi:MAG: GNAT family N-acetyltransferase [Thermoleophilia bacterium]
MDARDYSGPADLRLMQDLTAECWRLEGPYVAATIGDLPWWMYQHLNKLDEARVRLWLEGGRCVAWGWAEGGLIFMVHPEHRERIGDVLDWAEEDKVTALEHDTASIEVLGARSYEVDDSRWFDHMTRSLDDLPEPRVHDGYVLRAVRGEEELVARTKSHRAAWEPSRVVPESYVQVMRAWPYRAELDWVAVAPDGTFAANCLCWLDAQNRIVELEPVGTHPDHRRRGLAAAVCLAALQAARAAGAETGLVYPVNGLPAAALYESIGFRTISRHLTFRKRD